MTANTAGLPSFMLQIDAPLTREDTAQIHKYSAELIQRFEAAIEQRDQARDLFAHMEERHELLTQTLHKVREYAQGLIGDWTSNGVGLDLLAILNAENDDVTFVEDETF